MHARPALSALSALTLLLVLSTPTRAAAVPERELEIAAAVIEARPAALVLEVERHGSPARPVRIELARHDLRAPGFAARAWLADGTTVEVEAPAATYRGTLAGDADASVVASLGRDGLTAWVLRGGEVAWWIEPVPGPAGSGARDRAVRHRVREGSPFASELACGLTTSVSATVLGGGLARFRHGAEDRFCQREVEIAFDADFEYFQLKGSSVQGVVDAIEAQLSLVDLFYARDLRVTFRLTHVIVRTAPFYAPTNGGSLLDLFRGEWNANQAAVPRDVAHLMTGKPGSLIEYGGLAYVGVACNLAWAYGWSMDGANIVGHELGHNLGAGHCHDTDPCNTMCGACFHVGPNTKAVMNAYLAGQSCLDEVEGHATPLPPYAHPDAHALTKDRWTELEPARFDVLANDEDGNCEPVRIAGFDAASAQGGTVSLSAGTGPGGRDELLYHAPAEPFVGRDTVGYLVGDGTGATAPGTLTIDVRPADLTGAWALDDGAGTIATDASPAARHGTLVGPPLWTAGVHGGALALDGAGDRVAIPPLGLVGTHVTLTARVRRSGAQAAWTGLVFSRAGSTVAGLRLAAGHELRYTWNETPSTYGFATGLVVPDGQWVFVAVAVEPERATVYLHDGTQLHAATNVATHAPEAFDGTTFLGWDPFAAARHFTGSIDDVRVYDHALDAARIEALARDGGRAELPRPADGEALAFPDRPLTWHAAPLATAHEVYLGASFSAVRDATPASPEFVGSFARPGFTPAGLVEGARRYWRVDEVKPAGRVTGDVWQFELVDSVRWKLDELAGTAALDANGTDHGTYVGGPALGGAGATAALGTSVAFDAVNDSVSIPPLHLDDNRFTITTWVRRAGPQNAWAGLVFWRSGASVAGLGFGEANELRYHWNGGEWGFDSGLVVPDAQWVLAALVVEPDRATLYLHDGTTLASAVNAVGHAPEELDAAGRIGWDPHSAPRRFKGSLDDVRVFRKALSEEEILTLWADSQ